MGVDSLYALYGTALSYLVVHLEEGHEQFLFSGE